MSGVRQGSRLAHLHALRTRLDHEIAAETAREVDATAGRTRPGEHAVTPPAEVRVAVVESLPVTYSLAHLGVTAAEVREWARTAGHHVASRGKLPADIVAFYAQAHPERTTA